MNSFYVYAGNAAVGTTTCAGATGVALADRGHETAIVSFDPLNSLSKAFGTQVGPEPTSLGDRLTGVEISPEAGQETYVDLFEKLADGVSTVGIDLDDGHVGTLVRNERLPFGRQLAALEAVASFVGDPFYDAVVFDTGPRTKLFRLLRKPEMVGMGINVAQDLTNEVERVADDARDRLDERFGWGEDGTTSDDDAELPPEADEEIHHRVQRVSTTLDGAGRRQLRVVTTPEDVSVRYVDWRTSNLASAGIPSGPLFLNQVVRDYEDSCDRCRARHDHHQEVIADLRERFDDMEVCVLPDCRGEAEDRAMLELLAEEVPV